MPKINFQTCMVHSGRDWLMWLQFWLIAVRVRAMPCYIVEACVHCKSCREECRHPGRHRPAEAVGLSPGAASPPFFSLISTRRGSPISMKKVLFFSYSSSSITLTAIVLLKQRRIEIDEQGRGRHAKEHRQEEGKVREATENIVPCPGPQN